MPIDRLPGVRSMVWRCGPWNWRNQVKLPVSNRSTLAPVGDRARYAAVERRGAVDHLRIQGAVPAARTAHAFTHYQPTVTGISENQPRA